MVQTESGEHVAESKDMMIEGFSCSSVGKTLETGKVVAAVSTVSLPTNFQSNAEDIDMYVEMEVDQETVSGSSDVSHLLIHSAAPVEQIIQPLVCSSVSLDDPDIPPHPDEEWIPSPPPDNEPVHPPPPEELPEYPPVAYPPYANYMPATCPEQYGSVYALPTYEYYTLVSDETTASYYVQVDGAQGAESQLQYKSAFASSFLEVVADVNSVNPLVCYDFSSTAFQVPAVTSSGISGVYIESGPVNYPTTAHALENSSSMDCTYEAKSISVTNVEQETAVISAYTSECDMVSTKLSTGASVQDKGDALMNGNVIAASIAATKSQPKATRGKKRMVAIASTLRSNKKVASLVNKWKAAKEELHSEEDEEPEDAYEILEKKHQKEIEEWHACQITSGEARDNVNFLPLGGDWRKRVKHRRAEAKAFKSEAP